eukprot:1497841-Prymnesium_polylepis.1
MSGRARLRIPFPRGSLLDVHIHDHTIAPPCVTPTVTHTQCARPARPARPARCRARQRCPRTAR